MSFFKPQSSESEKVALEILKSQNARLSQQVGWLQNRVDTLITQILGMKKEGFTWTPPIERTEQPSVDPRIMAAIRSRAKEGSTLERDLFEFAQSHLILDREVEDVVDMILAGGEVD